MKSVKNIAKVKVSRSLGGNIAIFTMLAVLGLFTALPIIYMLVNAVKPLNELYIFPPRLYVSRPTLDNFLELMRLQDSSYVPFERYLFNSIFITVFTTVIYIFLATAAAYPLAKLEFKGKTVLFQLVVWAILFRTEVTGIPQYVILSKLHLINTPFAIIFPALAGSFGIFLMRQFILTVPNETIESARMDGLGEIGIVFRMIMPMVKPAWLTLIIFTFQGLWNTTGVQFIYSENLKLLPTALSQISSSGYSYAGVTSAVSVILLIPPVLIFLLTQNSVIETMSHSGLK